jgi:DNA repair exonuclease SbcCD ATPase subunit
MPTLRSLVFPLSITLAMCALVPGCQSSAPNAPQAATGKTVTQAADEIDLGIKELDATVASLKDLTEKPAADPAPQFKAFSKNLDALDARAKSVSALATKMDENSRAYFTQWDKQIAEISNEDIRERNQERRTAIDKSLNKLREKYSEAKEKFKPLISDLKDVRTSLQADLSPDGIDTVRKTSGKIADHAEDVKETMGELSAEYRKLGVGLGNLPPPPPK